MDGTLAQTKMDSRVRRLMDGTKGQSNRRQNERQITVSSMDVSRVIDLTSTHTTSWRHQWRHQKTTSAVAVGLHDVYSTTFSTMSGASFLFGLTSISKVGAGSGSLDPLVDQSYVFRYQYLVIIVADWGQAPPPPWHASWGWDIGCACL